MPLFRNVCFAGVALAATVGVARAQNFIESGGLVSMEAENATGSAAGTGAAAGKTWSGVTSPTGYTGASALQALTNSGVSVASGVGPRADFAVNFTTTGTYYVSIRMRGPTGNDDSLWVGLNGTSASTANVTVSQSNVWQWRQNYNNNARITVNVTSAGTHTLNLWMREDGTIIDKVVLSTSSTYQPNNVNSGAGPAESARAQSGGSLVNVIVDNPAATLTGSWTTQTSGSGYTGSNYLRSGEPVGTKTARFTPNLSEAGKYVVYLKTMGGSAQAAGGNPNTVTITHAGGTTTLQNVGKYGTNLSLTHGGQWLVLGAYDFNAGTAGNLLYSTNADNQYHTVTVDSVRFFKPAAVAQDPAITAGLASWRTPDPLGQRCADCHGMHGFDLAVFNFDAEGDIVRRALGHVNQTDANKIRDMLVALRGKYNITQLDKLTDRPFQTGNGGLPGGNAYPLAGAMAKNRDKAFIDQLKAANLDIATVYIDTQSEAIAAKDELYAFSPWDIKDAIPMNLYSQDGFRGESEKLMAEWVPMLARSPRAANAAEWWALHDAYNISPDNETLWRIFDKMGDLTEVPAASLTNSAQATGNAAWLSFNQLRALLILQHFDLKRTQGQLSTFFDKNKRIQDQWVTQSGISNRAEAPMESIWRPADTARVTIGAIANQPISALADLNQGYRLPQREVDAKMTNTLLVDQHFWKFRLPWFHNGWLLDQSANRIGGSGSDREMEYYMNSFGEFGGGASAVDHQYLTLPWFIMAKRAVVFRYDPAAPSAANSANFWFHAAIFELGVPNTVISNTESNLWNVFADQTHRNDYKTIVGNYHRMSLHLMERELDNGTYAGSGESQDAGYVDRAKWDLSVVDPANTATNDALANRVKAKIYVYYPGGN